MANMRSVGACLKVPGNENAGGAFDYVLGLHTALMYLHTISPSSTGNCLANIVENLCIVNKYSLW